MFLFKKRDDARRKTIERLYGAIVAQARTPAFYLDFGVPDTVEGRFDLLVLHMHLANARLVEAGEAGVALGQEVLDRFFEDMDASLREIGIGDLSVPKKMRTLAEAYLGRSVSYGAAITTHDTAALAQAIARNILGRGEGAEANANALAAYALQVSGNLHAQATETLLCGEIVFPEARRAAHAE
jgi:cytochrome b pre-mRNA-processing protein 3